MSTKRIGKVLAKLEGEVAAGNYYEAHQMYHSVCQRYVKQKQLNDAFDLVQAGIKVLARHGQYGSALDLAMRMLDVFEDKNLPLNDEARARFVEAFDEFPVAESGGREFARAVLRWTAKVCGPQFGDSLLHHAFGARYYREMAYYEAEAHLLYGTVDSGKLLGCLSWDFGQQSDSPDRGYFIARVVLQLVCLKKIHHATVALETYIKAYQQSSRGSELASEAMVSSTSRLEVRLSSQSPLSNFAQFLLATVQRDGSAELYFGLRNQYKAELGTDEFLEQLYDRIGRDIYDLGPKRAPNMLDDLMKSFFGGGAGGGSVARGGISTGSVSELD
ncbi:hypothetical protein BJ742DRAFT_682538 [Cladochytrium replicatum]|nr:hypothetical protein BJ742DRAFT_682538 [Cladochytrium replicatum]